MEDLILFSEKQYFIIWWGWVLGLLILLSILFNRRRSTKASKPKGSSWPYRIAIGFYSLLCLLLATVRLETQITASAIKVRYFPLHWSFKTYEWASLRSVRVVEYSGLRDFGGWGIRENRQTKAYTMAGSQGLVLEFFQGKALLIGTQQADSLRIILQNR